MIVERNKNIIKTKNINGGTGVPTLAGQHVNRIANQIACNDETDGFKPTAKIEGVGVFDA